MDNGNKFLLCASLFVVVVVVAVLNVLFLCHCCCCCLKRILFTLCLVKDQLARERERETEREGDWESARKLALSKQVAVALSWTRLLHGQQLLLLLFLLLLLLLLLFLLLLLLLFSSCGFFAMLWQQEAQFQFSWILHVISNGPNRAKRCALSVSVSLSHDRSRTRSRIKLKFSQKVFDFFERRPNAGSSAVL